jgi:hypothetical protein
MTEPAARPRRVIDVVVPTVLGVVGGVAGYLWFDWALSHADPPL